MRYLLPIILSSICSATFAEQESPYTPEEIVIVDVRLDDDATGGCWTNLKESREYAEEQLRLNGYKFLGIQNGDTIATEEDKAAATKFMRQLGGDTEEHLLYGAYLHHIQQNKYSVMLSVSASRSTSGCYGFVSVDLTRYAVGHSRPASSEVSYTYTKKIFSNVQNANIVMLDVIKAFVKYIKSGSVS